MLKKKKKLFLFKRYETYHGVYVNIQYGIKVMIPRPFLAKNLTKDVEYIVQVNVYNPPINKKKYQF